MQILHVATMFFFHEWNFIFHMRQPLQGKLIEGRLHDSIVALWIDFLWHLYLLALPSRPAASAPAATANLPQLFSAS